MISVAIMAHPKRHIWVEELHHLLEYEGEVIWDRYDDEWDTGARALAAFDPEATHHVVLQDDALLCVNFLKGAEEALRFTPPEVPVSFYTGKVRPHPEHIEQAVAAARQAGKAWLALRGPLWAPAVAIPTESIPALLEENLGIPAGDYDMRISEYFHSRGVSCWYSQPSLVDHRTGSSLLPDREGLEHRRAHDWIGGTDPTLVDWDTPALHVADPSEKWSRTLDGFHCGACEEVTHSLAAMVTHHSQVHDLDKVDLIAVRPSTAHLMRDLYNALPEGIRGKFWSIGIRIAGAENIRPTAAKRHITRKPARFTIVDTSSTLRYLGGRSGWAMDGGAN